MEWTISEKDNEKKRKQDNKLEKEDGSEEERRGEEKGGRRNGVGGEREQGKDEIIKRENRQREVGRKRGGREGRARIQFTQAVY